MDPYLILAILASILGFSLVVALTVLPLWSIIDLFKYPQEAWATVPGSRRIWLAVIICGAQLGALAYVIGVRGRLKRAEMELLEGAA